MHSDAFFDGFDGVSSFSSCHADPGHPGKHVEWVLWDNARQPEGKRRVPNLCSAWLKTEKCEWFDKGKCERPHIDKDERDRRKKVLDAHKW